MRRLAALSLAGDMDLFFARLTTDLNPADRPSSWHGLRAAGIEESFLFSPRAKRGVGAVVAERVSPASSASTPEDFELLPCAISHPQSQEWHLLKPVGLTFYFVLHLCAGPRRKGDFTHACAQALHDHGVSVMALAVDPLIDKRFDILSEPFFRWLMSPIAAGRVIGALGSPPCSTWSRARHVPLPGGGGPRLLRSREKCLECLPDRLDSEVRSCAVGTWLLLAVVYLLGLVVHKGGLFALEHPAGPGPPYPSIFASAPVLELLGYCQGIVVGFDKCLFGAVALAKKSADLATSDLRLSEYISGRCCHIGGHASAIGLRHGRFCATCYSSLCIPACTMPRAR